MPKIPKKLVQKKVKPEVKADESEEKEIPEPTSEELETPAEDDEEVPEKLKSPSASADESEEKEVPEEDYLRQYQFKKVKNIPTIGGVLTDPDKGSKAERMKEHLLKQKKVFSMIPLPEGTDPKIPYSVTLNGYRLDLPTNSYIDLPEQVSEIIRNSLKQTLAALSRDRIESNSKPGADNALGR